MGVVNYFTSDYITMGLRPYDSWDLEKDPEFMEKIRRECEEYGCPIEDEMENARFKIERFPNVILEVWIESSPNVLLEAWDGEKCINWHHCPFYRKDANKQLEALSAEHLYKVVGQPDTYRQYNEGWQDCLDRVMQIVRSGGI